ncbi:hypothetical protein COCON_G00002880 [Conger conger]|uniref:Hematopoietic cell signal transducer n=2 Tax=Conger conger TaxID=82655 RepID=A0A9Q1E113_CONCO|nr:hematopoietic cell signal transducer isoform X2 [Conger conger]XP_061108917.1 hematopoietic cell signal transducer isoform X2 [Conger conger]XP_061108926.1 hematopoietic cell signal transducer isoform X2 [Conger conger]XP_061108934.1 hematopoietic cell signal transducer isoform X2 [Conger conger]XP_061108943.1 hematopoietic cell signal transducer isoform X2 [Conger conger]KAJ8287629.1 hypothetical protein COCON_G00002880 [Conger conger]
MDDNALLMFLCLCFYKMVLAAGQNESEYCYKIKPATMTGIILGDVGLTVLIVVVVYYCASQRMKRREEADKVYMNVRANCQA